MFACSPVSLPPHHVAGIAFQQMTSYFNLVFINLPLILNLPIYLFLTNLSDYSHLRCYLSFLSTLFL